LVANIQCVAQITVRASLKAILDYGMGVNEEGFGEMAPCLIWHLSKLNRHLPIVQAVSITMLKSSLIWRPGQLAFTVCFDDLAVSDNDAVKVPLFEGLLSSAPVKIVRRATGENDSDEILTQVFQLSKGNSLLSVVLVGMIYRIVISRWPIAR
jgi:hypothetical protein